MHSSGGDGSSPRRDGLKRKTTSRNSANIRCLLSAGHLFSTAIISREEVESRAGLGGKNPHWIQFWTSLFLWIDFFIRMGHKPRLKAAGRTLCTGALLCVRCCSEWFTYLLIHLTSTTLGRYYNLRIIDKETETQRFSSLPQSPMANRWRSHASIFLTMTSFCLKNKELRKEALEFWSWLCY